jgi:signal transduction histidine kinase
LEKALATYSSDFQKFNIQVDWKTETDSWVQGDAEWMEQALGNLIKNSIQALESVDRERRLIRILLGHTETGKVWIQFRDHGPGLTTEIKNQLFKPFFTTKSEGTGLGLSFVKHVFEQQGGQFDVMMPVQGQFEGACFQGFLPLAAQEAVKNIQTLVERNSERDSERNSLL